MERLVSGPYLELFGRVATPGWVTSVTRSRRTRHDDEIYRSGRRACGRAFARGPRLGQENNSGALLCARPRRCGSD